jgi:5'-nucleotidase
MRSRTFLLAIAAALLVGAGPAQAHDGGHGHHHKSHHKRHKPRAVDVQLLSINDFHGNLAPPGTLTLPGGVRTPAGGAEYLATHLDALRATNPNTLVVSAGDNIGASPLVSGLFHDEPTIEAFNAMGVDISSVGNHEFDEGSAELLRMQDGGCHPDGCYGGDGFDGADFDYLAANVVDDDTGRTLFRPYEVRRVGGVKVGFIGVVLEDTPSIVTPSGVEGLTFGDEADAINKYTAKLKRKGVKAIVVLMHQGDTVDLGQVNDCLNPVGPLADIIGRSSKEVDLYLTGHTHQAYNCMIGGKRATSASSFGRVLTDADLRVDRRTGQVVSVSADNKIVTQDVAKDPEQTAILKKYTDLSAPIANRLIGASTAPLTREQNAAGESVLGDIIADSQLAATAPDGQGNAVIALMNPGGIRTDLDAGDITYAEAFAVQPFGNSLVTMTLTGAQIDRVLEQQWDGQGTSPKVLQVSNGLTYTWHSGGPLGSRVDDASIKIGGVTVDPAASYRVTVNSFLADGGDGFTALRNGTDRLGGDIDLDALADYLGAHNPIAPTARDRITVVP